MPNPMTVTAILLSLLCTGASLAATAALECDGPAEVEAEPAQSPRTQAQWRERIESLTPGMTPEEVVDAIGRDADTMRKSSPGQLRLNYYYYVGNIKQPQWLILHFTDGVYTRAQW